jgi:hypothetical protein
MARRNLNMLLWAVVCTIIHLLWTLSSPVLAFDTWWHAEATKKAMSASGFSGDARLVARITNYLVDFYRSSDRTRDFMPTVKVSRGLGE